LRLRARGGRWESCFMRQAFAGRYQKELAAGAWREGATTRASYLILCRYCFRSAPLRFSTERNPPGPQCIVASKIPAPGPAGCIPRGEREIFANRSIYPALQKYRMRGKRRLVSSPSYRSLRGFCSFRISSAAIVMDGCCCCCKEGQLKGSCCGKSPD